MPYFPCANHHHQKVHLNNLNHQPNKPPPVGKFDNVIVMIISNTHQVIDALKKMVPGGFVFVMDTTDRSFVYKSSDHNHFEQQVISLDRVHGIDTLTKSTDFYSHDDETSVVKLKRIGQNTFMGLCASKNKLSEDEWGHADDFFQVLN